MYDEAHNNNIDSIFIGLNKRYEKHGRRKKKIAQEKIKKS
jgi:hypothetical protein